MADSTERSSLEALAEVLIGHGVEFIVIGGQAETLYGSARPTYDVDLCYRRTTENLRRLAVALRAIRPTLRNAPPDLPFVIDERSLALGSSFTLECDHGALDLLGYVEPLGTYEDLDPRAERIRVGDLELHVIALEDLITIKRHLRRPKDQLSLMHLEAVQRVRGESSDDS